MKLILTLCLSILVAVASQSDPNDWFIGDLATVDTNFTQGAAELTLTFPIGSGPSSSIVTVYEKGCVNEITDGGITVDSSLDTGVGDAYVEVTFDKTSLVDGKPYVNYTEADFSAGEILFCTKLEMLASDGTSVSFKKTEFAVSFDLSEISFVVSAEIDEDEVDVVNVDDADITGGIDACICSASSYDCDPNPPIFVQTDVPPEIFICIQATSSDYIVSNFELNFLNPENGFDYSPVSLGLSGPEPDFLTDIDIATDGTNRVKALVVSDLFEDEASTVNIEGSGSLTFASGKNDEELQLKSFSLTIDIVNEEEEVEPISTTTFLTSILDVFMKIFMMPCSIFGN